jgi:hypothetical protein
VTTKTHQDRGAALGAATAHIDCATCGVDFAIPRKLQEIRLIDGATFYCPFGHHNVYGPGKSREELQRERAEAFERQLANLDETLRSERASHAATKGKLTRERKRTTAGVCPCCDRSFVQLARHMKTKHPDFGGDQ